jgi:thiol-disulfide isomerase/thioredoxin
LRKLLLFRWNAPALLVKCVALTLLIACLRLPLAAQVTDLSGHPADPFASLDGFRPPVTVLIFLRSDCPISNRYAPEIQRLASIYSRKGAHFWLVYPDASDPNANVQKNISDYGYKLPVLRDPSHELVKRSQAAVMPEAAVFLDGQLVYHGRVDDRVAAFGISHPQPTTHDLEDALRAAVHGHIPAKATAPGVGCYISDIQ